ncbi:MAG: tRNA threonylcarbamoyladenosine biosynthesis protein TsaE [Candidatus Anoxychlamydiales bacterium]|nr:tRNA threonylcarbamoyladenosine biosynthesis protein TsaE [Candidatus Anoxychlamydiales bacterium]
MAKIKKIVSNSTKETIQFAKDLSKHLKKGSIVAFLGDLGSGKTTFIKGIVKALSETKNINVTSPTFVYLNIYGVKIPIYHFDLYRIKDKDHFYEMGFEEYFSSSGICLIEWSENILDILPKDTIFIKMTHITEQTREIEITNAF